MWSVSKLNNHQIPAALPRSNVPATLIEIPKSSFYIYRIPVMSNFASIVTPALLVELHNSKPDKQMDGMSLSPAKDGDSVPINNLIDSLSTNKIALQNRDIPTEIWFTIFRYAVDGSIQDYISEPLRPHQRLIPPPITLSHVCRRWNSIIRELPELWSTIPTCPRQLWTQNEANIMELAKIGAEGRLARSVTATIEPVTLLLDVSARFDSKEAMSRDQKSRDMVPVHEPTRTIEGRKSLMFPNSGHNVYIFRRPSPPSTFQNSRKSKISTEIGPIVRIGGAHIAKPTTKPISLTLHWPRRSEFSRQTMFLFYSYQPTNVTLIDHFSGWPLAAGPMTIRTLRLKTSERQRLVSLNGMLQPWIEELYVHSCWIDVESPGPHLSSFNRTLPNLCILGVTPLHISLFTEVQFPGLQKVILYPPDIRPRARKVDKEWLTTLGDAIKSITTLEFEAWPEKYQRNVPYYSIAPLLLGLLSHLPRLSKVVCRQSFVWGEGLVRELPLALGDANASGGRLEEIVFDECTGLTRAHCDALYGVVGSIRVM